MHCIVMTVLNLFWWGQQCISLVTVILVKNSLECSKLLFNLYTDLSLLHCKGKNQKQSRKHHTEINSTASVLRRHLVEVGGGETGEANDVFLFCDWFCQLCMCQYRGDFSWEPGVGVSPASLGWGGGVLPASVVWQEGFRRIIPRH